MESLKTTVTVVRNVMLGSIAIWQLFQVGGFLDPFRGWKGGLPQLVAALLFILSYLATRRLLEGVLERELTRWPLIVGMVFLTTFLYLSLSIVLSLSLGAIATLLFALACLALGTLLTRIPKNKLKSRQAIGLLLLSVILLIAAFTIVLGLLPDEYPVVAKTTEWRLQATLIFYSAFAINLGVVIALLNPLKRGMNGGIERNDLSPGKES